MDGLIAFHPRHTRWSAGERRRYLQGSDAGWILFLLWASAAATDPFAPCEVQAAPLDTLARPRPDHPLVPWWQSPEPCPAPTMVDGAPPPQGTGVRCLDRRGRMSGPETLFSRDGAVVRESEWRGDREVGYRYDWDCAGQAVQRRSEFSRGLLDGEVVEWLPDGGVSVQTFRAGVEHGPSWTLLSSGDVMRIEHWADGERLGRACVRRAEVWESTVYGSDGRGTSTRSGRTR